MTSFHMEVLRIRFHHFCLASFVVDLLLVIFVDYTVVAVVVGLCIFFFVAGIGIRVIFSSLVGKNKILSVQ